jgi:chondroitin-sulfate-ABC endolyase/exolyase
LITVLDGTDYELSPGAYEKVKNAFLAARLWGWPWSGFNACGRHPLLSSGQGFVPAMQAFANAAPGTDEIDAELTVSPDRLQGAWSMNYHSGLVYKHGNSTVLLKGFGSGVRSHETYGTDNRYGSYGSHGTVQVFSNTRAHNSGFEHDGWGWSQPPGATTLILPLDVLEADVSFYGRRVPQSAPFAGGSHLDHKIGLFAFQLDPDPKMKHAEALKVRKSVLCVDGKLICLGSGLSSKTEYPLATTIFQCGLRADHDAVQRGTNWIIDPYGTGHWVAPGNLMKEHAGRQESRHNKTKEITEGDFAMAWLDHGTGAKGASYEYVSVLEADAAKMDVLTSKPFYSVKRQDDRTHAVLVPGEKLWSLVNFQSLEEPVGPFFSVSQPCLVLMQQLSGSNVRISVADPRLELSPRKTAPPVDVVLEIKGKFKLTGTRVDGVFAKIEGNNTILNVRCAEGEPTAFSLRKGM